MKIRFCRIFGGLMLAGLLVGGARLVAFHAESDSDVIVQTIRELTPSYGSAFWKEPSKKHFGTLRMPSDLPIKSDLLKVRSRIESLISRGSPTAERFLSAYLRGACKSRGDHEALYQWSYASIVYADYLQSRGKRFWSTSLGFQIRGLQEWLLAEVQPLPKDSEFIRLRFLIESTTHYRPDLLDLGNRLLKRNPNDTLIRRAIIYQLSCSSTKADLNNALERSTKLMSERKGDALVLGLHLRVYLSRWLKLNMQKSDGLAYIKHAEDYLKLVPKNSEVAQSVRQGIQQVKSDLATISA